MKNVRETRRLVKGPEDCVEERGTIYAKKDIEVVRSNESRGSAKRDKRDLAVIKRWFQRGTTDVGVIDWRGRVFHRIHEDRISHHAN